MRIMEKLGSGVAEKDAGKVIKLMVRAGDDAFWVIEKPNRLAMFLKWGDQAADAVVKHKGIADGLVEQFGGSAARALTARGESWFFGVGGHHAAYRAN